jgi:hypothetical protein
MPTARELLEQAEALMRRDRIALMADKMTTADDAAPALARSGTTMPTAPPFDTRPSPTALDDIPLLTDAVDDFDNPSIPHPRAAEDDASIWGEGHDDDASILGPDQESLAPSAEDKPQDQTGRTSEPSFEEVAAAANAALARSSPATESASNEAARADDERWSEMAEEIRMQVLQRIDIFTDTGLKEQLNLRLQPIVDRASADLVAAINQHVGQLLRAYVAEAIEREIEKWRETSP